MYSTGKWWMWLGFVAFVVFVVAIDIMFLGGKKARKVTVKEALGWVSVWVSCALLFNLWLWHYLTQVFGAEIANRKALEFFSGYLIEQSLSVDNMFAFIMVFKYFSIPREYQRRVLLYGILSAIVLRLIIILSGVWLVSKLAWILYIFGAFLVYTGVKMLFPENETKSLAENPLLLWMQRHIRITDRLYKDRFFVKINYLWYATPMLLVLALIEISDIVFALDSIPAIFAITDDAFIIFTSNVFAILGLRALFFLLSNLEEKFFLLRYGIAVMLTFIGVKMLVAHWIEIPITFALGVLVAILSTTIILSLIFQSKRIRHE